MPEIQSSEQKFRAIGPGRVNLLGEHIDYNDGPVLPAAIDRQVVLDVEKIGGSQVTLLAPDLQAQVRFSLENLAKKVDLEGKPLPIWARYPAGVAWALQQRGLPTVGFTGSYTSDIPIGSGLSSSAAIEVAFASVWQTLGGWTLDPLVMAQICQRAENVYVGVNCGLMDQFASACGVPGQALYFDTRSLEWHPVPLPAHTAIIIADSTMRRSLSNSAYNERRSECEDAVRRLQVFLPAIQSLRDVTPEQFSHYASQLPEVIRMRAQHVVSEIARVEQAVLDLQTGDAAHFGQMMLECHASLRDQYQVSIPELDLLVDLASRIPGCLGARLSGAGFGGCTVNLVQEDQAAAFIWALKAGYEKATGRVAPVYACRASRGAHTDPLP